jgi:hypothetical protein
VNVQIDPGRKREFDELCYRWQKERLQEPNSFLAGVGLPTPMDHGPGQLWFRVEAEFADVLRAKHFPFTLI